MKNHIFVIILVSVALWSCSEKSNHFFSAKTEYIVFQIEPPLISSDFDVSWIDENGYYQEKTITELTSFLGLKLQKNLLTPVIIQTEDEYIGTIYPLSTKINSIDGFSAFILFRLLAGSKNLAHAQSHERLFCSKFNWYKFSTVIQEKAIQEKVSPWKFDTTKIIKAIASGSFTKNCIKVLQ